MISGLTVMISLAGLFLTGIDLFTGMAFGTITVVGVAVVGSLTLLPALLAMLGELGGPLPGPVPRPPPDRGQAVAAVGRAGPPGGAPPGDLGRRGHARAAGARGARARDADRQPGHRPADNLASCRRWTGSSRVPGQPAPADVVVTGQDLAAPLCAHALAALEHQASRPGPIRDPIAAAIGRARPGAGRAVPLAGNGSDNASTSALLTLRDQVLPATLGRVSGVSYAVTGNTASQQRLERDGARPHADRAGRGAGCWRSAC